MLSNARLYDCVCISGDRVVEISVPAIDMDEAVREALDSVRDRLGGQAKCTCMP